MGKHSFQEVMKQWQRMCKSYIACEKCPVNNILVLCDDMPWIVSDIPGFEATIMKWAAEHPEPRYPSWGEWLSDIGVFACRDGEWLFEKANEIIPEDFAERNGIEPVKPVAPFNAHKMIFDMMNANGKRKEE